MMDKKLIITAVVVAVILIIALCMYFAFMRRLDEHDDEPQEQDWDKSKDRRHTVGSSQVKLSGIKIKKVDGQTQVSWNPINDADHYTMYYSETPNFDLATANTHNPITEPLVMLASDVPRTYYFKVASAKKVKGKVVETAISDQFKMQLDRPKK